MFETLLAFFVIGAVVGACTFPFWLTKVMAIATRWMWPTADGYMDVAAYRREVGQHRHTAFQGTSRAYLHTIGSITDVDDTNWLYGLPDEALPESYKQLDTRRMPFYKVSATCNLTRYVYAYVPKTPENTALLRNLMGLIELKGTVYAGQGTRSWYMYPAEVCKAPRPRFLPRIFRRQRRKTA